MPEGYSGLPPYYVESSDPVTPFLGLSLVGMDPIIAEDFVLVDSAFGNLSLSIQVNGVVVPPVPNFVNSGTVTWSVIGSNIFATATGSSGSGFPTRFVTVTANYNAVAGDFVLCNTTGGGLTVTLPLSAANALATICVKKVSSDTNTVTIANSASDTLDGTTPNTTAIPETAVECCADGGTTWRIY